MCGFAGIINYKIPVPVLKEELKAMGSAITHRGPDDQGIYEGPNFGLAFQRLSIIDLEAGHQPMIDSSGRWVITFNGEVYNFQEIRQNLQSKGVNFNTNSDTEVILEAFKQYGEKALDLFEGMFAFCIVDTKLGNFLIARDHFGIKPLYYTINSNGIYFASELKSLYAADVNLGEIDPTAVDSFFSYGIILAPHTIYNKSFKLPAAHYLRGNIFNGEMSDPIRYWTPHLKPDYSISYEEHRELLINALKKSVAKHLISDVPVGSFLSGGVDSSAVVGLVPEERRKALKTFTVGFELSGFDESPVAKNTANWLGTDHHEIRISSETKIDVSEIVHMYDEPFADSSAIPTYFISKYAAEHVKVALSGDGGDELFGGYDTYQRLQKLYKIPLPYELRNPLFLAVNKLVPSNYPGKRLAYILSRKKELFYPYTMQFPEYEKDMMFSKDFRKAMNESPAWQLKYAAIQRALVKDEISKVMEADIQTLMVDDMLTKVDRASMKASLEVRVPIISRTVFEVAQKIPVEYKIKEGQGKYILRDVLGDFITDEVRTGKKRGFTIPISRWFKDNQRDFAGDHLNSKAIREIINPKYLDHILNHSNLNSLSTRLWPLVVFSSWLNEVHKP